MAKRNYEKSFFLDFLTEAQVQEAQEVAEAKKQSVTDVLDMMVTKAIEDKPEAAAALEAARLRAMDNFASLIASPLTDLIGDDGDDDDSGFDKMVNAA